MQTLLRTHSQSDSASQLARDNADAPVVLKGLPVLLLSSKGIPAKTIDVVTTSTVTGIGKRFLFSLNYPASHQPG